MNALIADTIAAQVANFARHFPDGLTNDDLAATAMALIGRARVRPVDDLPTALWEELAYAYGAPEPFGVVTDCGECGHRLHPRNEPCDAAFIDRDGFEGHCRCGFQFGPEPRALTPRQANDAERARERHLDADHDGRAVSRG